MAYTLSSENAPLEVITEPIATENPLDIQDLWPITTDLTDAATRFTKAVHDIACALAEDAEPAATSLQQELLEIRARLIYTYSDICFGIISDTRVLISWTVDTAGATLRNDPSNSDTAHFPKILASILNGCSENRGFLEETRLAWDAFHVSLSQFYSARSRSSQSGVAAFLRNLGTFTSPSSSLLVTPRQRTEVSGDSAGGELERMIQSLDRIEAFWRKREGLFSMSGHSFSREDLTRFYQSCQQLGDAYVNFMDPLIQNELDLSYPRPPIVRTPRSLSESIKSQMSWRALLQP